MAKFNIEVELDWVDEENGYTIDEEIKEQVVSGVKDTLIRTVTEHTSKQRKLEDCSECTITFPVEIQ